MSKRLRLREPKKMGERDDKYGQTWWSSTHDQLEPVMFNLMDKEVHDGSVIEAETVELKTSKAGTDYHRLKKVTIISGGESTDWPVTGTVSTVTEAPQAAVMAKLEEILAEVKKLTTPADEERAINADPSEIEERGDDSGKDEVTLDDDEPIDMSDIPF